METGCPEQKKNKLLILLMVIIDLVVEKLDFTCQLDSNLAITMVVFFYGSGRRVIKRLDPLIDNHNS